MNTQGIILIIEDDHGLSDITADILSSKNYLVKQDYTGKEGLSLVKKYRPDVVLLDLMLPERNGMELLREIREYSQNISVLVISSISDEERKVKALDMGADDYIQKPIGQKELLARIRTAYRHLERNRKDGIKTETFAVGNLFMDFEKRQVRLRHELLKLTPNEYEILTLLAKNSGMVVTNSAMISAIWGPYVTQDTAILRVNIANIRKKIEDNPADPRYIYTEPGVGYRLVDEMY